MSRADGLNSADKAPSKSAGDRVPDDANDTTLVEAVKAGDQRAFRTLMQRHQRRVYAVAYGILHDREDALDVVQETFIKVHRNLERFNGDSAFYTWVYRITANLCIDRIRRGRRHRGVSFEDGIQHAADEGIPFEDDPAARFGDPTQAVRRNEILEAVADGMGTLSDNHRAVLTMRELDGLSYEEMAQHMECSKGTIMSRLFHARRNMQRVLVERLGVRPPAPAKTDGQGDEEGSNASDSSTQRSRKAVM